MISVLDWILMAVLLVSLLLGAWRGLVYEVLALLSWIAAFILAQWFAPDLAPKLPLGGASAVLRYALAFVLVFVLGVFVGGLLAKFVKKLFAAVGLRPADRALGAAFGLTRGVILFLVATVVVELTPQRLSPWWQESVGAGISMAALRGLKPVLPQEFGKYLPS